MGEARPGAPHGRGQARGTTWERHHMAEAREAPHGRGSTWERPGRHHMAEARQRLGAPGGSRNRVRTACTVRGVRQRSTAVEPSEEPLSVRHS